MSRIAKLKMQQCIISLMHINPVDPWIIRHQNNRKIKSGQGWRNRMSIINPRWIWIVTFLQIYLNCNDSFRLALQHDIQKQMRQKCIFVAKAKQDMFLLFVARPLEDLLHKMGGPCVLLCVYIGFESMTMMPTIGFWLSAQTRDFSQALENYDARLSESQNTTL